jgi:hypothetical protein
MAVGHGDQRWAHKDVLSLQHDLAADQAFAVSVNFGRNQVSSPKAGRNAQSL